MTFARLLMTLVAMLAIAAGLLRLRHERLLIRHQLAERHQELQGKEKTLWRQQIDIATYASPQVVDRLAREHRASARADLTAEPTPTQNDQGN